MTRWSATIGATTSAGQVLVVGLATLLLALGLVSRDPHHGGGYLLIAGLALLPIGVVLLVSAWALRRFRALGWWAQLVPLAAILGLLRLAHML